MRKIISQWSIGKYTALEINLELPMKKYTKLQIDGKEYDSIPICDLPIV